MASSRGRIQSSTAVVGIVWCLGIAWSPAALAGPLDGLPDASEGVSDATDDATDTVSGTVDSVTDTVDAVADSADQVGGGPDAVGGVGGTVDDTVDDLGGAVDEAVEDATDAVGETVDEGTDTISEATGGATDPVTDPIDNVLDGSDPADPAPAGGSGGPQRSSPAAPSAAVNAEVLPPGADTAVGASDGDVATPAGSWMPAMDPAPGAPGDLPRNDPRSPERTSDGKEAEARAPSRVAGALAEGASEEVPIAQGPASPWSRAVEAAADLAKHVAFPLALTLIVGGFLAIHNKLDRHDPKLALAPVDQDQEVLYF